MNLYTDRLELLKYVDVRAFLADINRETHRLEFKEKSLGCDRIAHYATAFANADGGLIVLGFKDPKAERGQPLTNGDKVDISDNSQRGYISAINARVYPPLPVEIQGYQSDDRSHAFMLIRIARSMTAPHEYLAKDNGMSNLPVRRDTQISNLRLSEIEALRSRRENPQTESAIKNQQYLPVNLQLQDANPDFIFGLHIRPEVYLQTVRALDANDDAFFASLEGKTRHHGDCCIHQNLTLEPHMDGVVFSSGKKVERHASGASKQPLQQIYIGADGQIVLRFQQNQEPIRFQLLAAWMVAYRIAQNVFYQLDISPSARVQFLMRLNGDRLNEQPVLPSGYDSKFTINLATQSYAEAFTDLMLRLYRAGAVSFSRSEVKDTLLEFEQCTQAPEDERKRWFS